MQKALAASKWSKLEGFLLGFFVQMLEVMKIQIACWLGMKLTPFTMRRKLGGKGIQGLIPKSMFVKHRSILDGQQTPQEL